MAEPEDAAQQEMMVAPCKRCEDVTVSIPCPACDGPACAVCGRCPPCDGDLPGEEEGEI